MNLNNWKILGALKLRRGQRSAEGPSSRAEAAVPCANSVVNWFVTMCAELTLEGW